VVVQDRHYLDQAGQVRLYPESFRIEPPDELAAMNDHQIQQTAAQRDG
jgi:hypothetical protein